MKKNQPSQPKGTENKAQRKCLEYDEITIVGGENGVARHPVMKGSKHTIAEAPVSINARDEGGLAATLAADPK